MLLTNSEEKVMLIIWRLTESVISNIRKEFNDPKPSRNTISTIVRILENKGFVSHKSYSRCHVYFPVITKEEYAGSQLIRLTDLYFDSSFIKVMKLYAIEKNYSREQFFNYISQGINEYAVEK